MATAPPLPQLSALERDELEWLLTSGVLGRSANLARVLRYLCEETAAGRGESVKEYTIAVEALGRRPNFDPQTDTIVRVTVHALRKRLQEIYADEAHLRPVRVIVPPGHYMARFVRTPAASLLESATETPATNPETAQTVPPPPPAASAAVATTPPPVSSPDSLTKPARTSAWLLPAILLGLGALAFGGWKLLPHASTPSGPTAPLAAVHTFFGELHRPYTDHSGTVWTPSTFCQGGGTISAPSGTRIAGTQDPALYTSGVRGIVRCAFPVKRGFYEVHLHFAEPTELEPATRVATVSINAGASVPIDIVDRAGGDGIATSAMFAGVTPESDGAIHVDYTSEVSPLNALEIIPTPSAAPLPVRIVAASSSYKDKTGQVWLADRDFLGGRRGQPPGNARNGELGLYAADRIGRFRYTIPAVPSAHYTLRLYFREPWFGQEYGVPGGPGSRVFNVSANGVPLLTNLDILAEGSSAPVIKSFPHLQASTSGTIELAFLPVVNYPLVNAIELVPEQ